MFANNYYINSSNVDSAIQTGEAARVFMSAGDIRFDNAQSVSADAQVTFNTRMKILSNGNVGIGTTSPAGKLHVYGGRSYFAPQGASNSGVNSHAAVFYNPHDSAFTANALAAYNAHTSWDIESRSTFTISPRTKDASIYTYAGEHATANAALNRFVQFNSNNTNALHQWNFYQYDGTGTAATDLKKPSLHFGEYLVTT